MFDIKNKINVGYNNFLIHVYNGLSYPNSNLSDYDIHPFDTFHTENYYKLSEIEEKFNIKFPLIITEELYEDLVQLACKFNSQKIDSIFDNTYMTFKSYTVDELYLSDKKFIYPLILYNNYIFEKYNTIDLDEKIVDCINRKQAKIVIIQLTEGFFGVKDEDFIFVSNLAKRYNFNKNSVIVVTSNMISDQRYNTLVKNNIILDNFTVCPYCYFQHNIWFSAYSNLLNDKHRNNMIEQLDFFKNKNKTTKKLFHFLCFNRIPKIHRLAIFAELQTNEKFKSKFITSMGSSITLDYFAKMIYWHMGDDYKYSKSKLIQYFSNYDCTKNYTYDESDLENNKASSFNKLAHSDSFLNIVTESLISENTVFFSEKTFKPIAALQPFIMIGNPYSLKTLKEMGFKTFDRWWDESYDDEKNFTRRFEKIIDLLEEISSWSMEKCFKITNEMEEILQHNFNVFIDNKNTLEMYQTLYE